MAKALIHTSLSACVCALDSSPLWTRVWTTSIAKVAPPRHYNDMFELSNRIVFVFHHLYFDKVLSRTLWASPCRPAIIASPDDEARVCSAATDLRCLLELLEIRRWWGRNVGERAFTHAHKVAITPVRTDRKEWQVFVSLVKQMALAGL